MKGMTFEWFLTLGMVGLMLFGALAYLVGLLVKLNRFLRRSQQQEVARW